MMFSESGRTQVWTSLIAAGALVLFWPLVRKKIALQKEKEALVLSSPLDETHQ
jgi:GABA permease